MESPNKIQGKRNGWEKKKRTNPADQSALGWGLTGFKWVVDEVKGSCS